MLKKWLSPLFMTTLAFSMLTAPITIHAFNPADLDPEDDYEYYDDEYEDYYGDYEDLDADDDNGYQDIVPISEDLDDDYADIEAIYGELEEEDSNWITYTMIGIAAVTVIGAIAFAIKRRNE